MFWVVAEAGIRGGELCGLGVEDVNFQRRTIIVQRSAWSGRLQTLKTRNAIRSFQIQNSWRITCRNFCRLTGRLTLKGCCS